MLRNVDWFKVFVVAWVMFIAGVITWGALAGQACGPQAVIC